MSYCLVTFKRSPGEHLSGSYRTLTKSSLFFKSFSCPQSHLISLKTLLISFGGHALDRKAGPNLESAESALWQMHPLLWRNRPEQESLLHQEQKSPTYTTQWHGIPTMG